MTTETTPNPAPPADSSSSFSQEKTFSTYNADQGRAYSEIRRDYDPGVYRTILDHHTSTGGQLDILVDVGCGTGYATRALAPHFTKVFGLDPAEGMISTARSSLTNPEDSTKVSFEISTCEELGSNLTPPVEDGSVDLITAANAAHWFDMPRFWAAASRVLKPGGMLTNLSICRVACHFDSCPVPRHAICQSQGPRHNFLVLATHLTSRRI